MSDVSMHIKKLEHGYEGEIVIWGASVHSKFFPFSRWASQEDTLEQAKEHLIYMLDLISTDVHKANEAEHIEFSL